MAAGQATRQAIGPINPAALVGQSAPVVEPRAVSALADAFRSGIITSQDILNRSGEAGRLRQKAEIQALTEATSPEAQAARAQAQQLAAAQTAAQLPLVEPMGQLAASQIEEQQAVQKYGPGIEYFKALAPEAGVAAPVTPEGEPDYAARAQLGLQLFEWKQKRTRAQERLIPAHWEKSPDGSSLFKFNKQGELITDELEKSLASQVVSPFAQLQPGTATTSATAGATPPVAQAPVPALTDAQRAQAVEQFGVAPENAAVMTGAEFQGLVEPKAQAPSKPTVSPGRVPGATAFLGEPKAKDLTEKIIPSEGVKDIAMSRQAVTIASRLQQRYQDLVQSEPHLVGFLEGRLATWTRSKEWNQKVAAFQRDATAILAPIAKGTYNETGVLSDKDVARYEGVIPSLKDNPKVGNQKINDLFNETRGSIDNKIDTWRRAGYDIKGFEDLKNMLPQASQPQQPGTSGDVVTLSTGRKIVRDANGNFRLIQ